MLLNKYKRLRSWREGRKDFIQKYGNYWNYIKSSDWQKKCEDFLEGSKKECGWCGSKKNLQVHHKHYTTLGSEKRRDVNIVCKRCHKSHHDNSEIFLININPVDMQENENQRAERFSELKIWRLKKARKMHKPAFLIFHDKTLKEISMSNPSNEEDLLWISGVGQTKLREYGTEIIRIAQEPSLL